MLKSQVQNRSISSTPKSCLLSYMEEMKKARAKKEATEWTRMEKEAGVSNRIPADIKEHEVIMNYLLKKGEITKRQAEGLRVGESGQLCWC